MLGFVRNGNFGGHITQRYFTKSVQGRPRGDVCIIVDEGDGATQRALVRVFGLLTSDTQDRAVQPKCLKLLSFHILEERQGQDPSLYLVCQVSTELPEQRTPTKTF